MNITDTITIIDMVIAQRGSRNYSESNKAM